MARRGGYKRDKNGRFASTGGGGRSNRRRRGGGGGGGTVAVRARSAAAIRRSAVATRSPGNVAIKGGSQPALRIPKGTRNKEIGIAIAFGAAGYGAYKLNQRRKRRKAARS